MHQGSDGSILFKHAKYGDRPIALPCGQCVSCRIKRTREWAVRCVHEAQMHELNCFVTLTYNDEHLPSDGSLDIRHWQLFAKRLRKRIGSFRFFACGEYGDDSGRPHYHFCLFGADFGFDRSLFSRTPQGNDLFTSPLLDEVWGKGFCTIGALTFESAAYVARYVMKKLSGEAALIRYMGVDLLTGEELEPLKREFITMSRGGTGGLGGIGSSWFAKYGSDVYPADQVVHEGKAFQPPRFYDGKLDPVFLLELKARRQELVGERSDDLTEDRLKIREVVMEAKLCRSRDVGDS